SGSGRRTGPRSWRRRPTASSWPSPATGTGRFASSPPATSSANVPRRPSSAVPAPASWPSRSPTRAGQPTWAWCCGRRATRPPLTGPVLAVATWDAKIGEPLLALYLTSTGQQLRQLNGPVQPIHSLAATPDGRLLASAADDQTVCVWGLTDLADILGRHATL